MRYLELVSSLLLIGAASPALAQQAQSTSDSTTAVQAQGAKASTAAVQAPSAAVVRAWTDSLARDPNGLKLSAADVHAGPLSVKQGDTVHGSIAAWHGNLDVSGTVQGDAVAVNGDVVLHPGALVQGDVVAVGGEVRNEGGKVSGETRTLSALSMGAVGSAVTATPRQVTRRSISLAVAWYLLLVVIGLPVVLFARPKLDAVTDRIRNDFSRAFLFGVVGQILIIPALVAICVALAITLVGILVIPFAVVAFVLAVLGALALGFLAMAYVTGDAVMRARGAAPPYGPPPVFQFLLIGLSIFLVLWVLGGAFMWAGVLGGILRFIAAIITWVAVTVGFGATLATRGGTRVMRTATLPVALPVEEETSWQTPTPVSGVTAARRPTPPPRQRNP